MGGKERRLFIDTKAFTVINQIYLQFVQMFDLQQNIQKPISQEAKTRKQVYPRYHCSTQDRMQVEPQVLKRHPTSSSNEHDSMMS